MQVVAIANDITYSSGSFGPREDAAFRGATEHALAERLPVVYLAANSGARVGLANEVKQCLQACLTQRSNMHWVVSDRHQALASWLLKLHSITEIIRMAMNSL